MLASPLTTLILIITCLLITILFFYLLSYRRKKNQITKIFIWFCCVQIFWLLCMLLQISFSNLFNIDPFYFDCFAYISICIMPVFVYLLSNSFKNTKFKFTKKTFLLFIIPINSLIVLWTNKFHNLFYITYSTSFSKTVYGPYFYYVHTVYSYLLVAIGIINLIRYSIKNSGFFSKQSMLIMSGILITLIINVLGTFGIIEMSIYITPISFSIALLFFALAIFKFDFLSVAPIALQKIVDRMSDAYIVVNEENVISDFNQTLLDLFKLKSTNIRNVSLYNLFEKYKKFGISSDLILNSVEKSRRCEDTIILEESLPAINKVFHIEINSITDKGNFLGTLILLKDITQHTQDMQTIKDNQDMLIEQERLASLGQMIGGIAHNLKTPIMSISGATEGLSDLIKEYEVSVGDPEVTVEDHHEIVNDMKEWIEKTKTHLSYMSDVITAIKGQAVAFSDQSTNSFTVKELINYVDILMKHELKNGIINLKTQADIDVKTIVKGNINSLVQVINNIISNAIQAYQSKGLTNKDINFHIYSKKQRIIFEIEDFAGGLPEKVIDKLFKEMVTTKGKNGTGLGLFMSYSNIKAHFNGTMRYETEKGVGTKFIIEIPIE